jgi:hypothetical protein
LSFNRLPLFLGPRDRHLARPARRIHVLTERPGDSDVDRIEQLRLNAVRAMVAQLAAVERMRGRNVELEQQLTGLRLAWVRRRRDRHPIIG